MPTDNFQPTRLPPLNTLRVFEAAARHASFRSAAVELCVTQAAVSQQIRVLEDRLRIKLFERTARGVVLTDAGHAYLDPIQRALQCIADATQSVTADRNIETLALSAPPTFGIRWLMPRLPAFSTMHAWINVRLFMSVSPIGIFPPNADAAIWHGRGHWPGTVARRLFRDDHLTPVCSPEVLSGPLPLREPKDLSHHTLLHGLREFDDWRTWLDRAGVDSVDPTKGPLFDSTSGAVQAATQGLGVAIGDDVRAGHLVVPFSLFVQSDSTYYLVLQPRRKRKPAIDAFAAWVLDEAKPLRDVARGTAELD
jgi:LysR family glycine cleavage system transcriptional activator